MQTLNKAVKILTLSCFLVTTVLAGSANSAPIRMQPQDKLAIASTNTDLMGPEHKDMGRIKMAVECGLKAAAYTSKLAGNPFDFKNLKETVRRGIIARNPIYQPDDMHIFYCEGINNGNEGVLLKVRITDEADKYGIRTYYARAGLTPDENQGFPVKVYKETDSATSATLISDADEKAIARYIEHQKNEDAVIRLAHKNNLVTEMQQKPKASYVATLKAKLNLQITTPEGLLPPEERSIFLVQMTPALKAKMKPVTVIDENKNEHLVNYDAHSSNKAIHMFVEKDTSFVHELGVILGYPVIGIKDGKPYNLIDQRWQKHLNGETLEPLHATVADLNTNLLTRDFASGIVATEEQPTVRKMAEEIKAMLDSKNAAKQQKDTFQKKENISALRAAIYGIKNIEHFAILHQIAQGEYEKPENVSVAQVLEEVLEIDSTYMVGRTISSISGLQQFLNETGMATEIKNMLQTKNPKEQQKIISRLHEKSAINEVQEVIYSTSEEPILITLLQIAEGKYRNNRPTAFPKFFKKISDILYPQPAARRPAQYALFEDLSGIRGNEALLSRAIKNMNALRALLNETGTAEDIKARLKIENIIQQQEDLSREKKNISALKAAIYGIKDKRHFTALLLIAQGKYKKPEMYTFDEALETILENPRDMTERPVKNMNDLRDFLNETGMADEIQDMLQTENPKEQQAKIDQFRQKAALNTVLKAIYNIERETNLEALLQIAQGADKKDLDVKYQHLEFINFSKDILNMNYEVLMVSRIMQNINDLRALLNETDAVVSRKEAKEANMVTLANEVGPKIAPPVKKYTIFTSYDFYSGKDEYEQDKTDYADRFNLNWIKVSTAEQYVARVLDTIATEELDASNIIVQFPVMDIVPENLNTLTSLGVRVMIINTQGLKQDKESKKYRKNVYSMMLLARNITEKDITENSSVYQLLQYFINSLMEKTPMRAEAVALYIKNLTTGQINTIIKTTLFWKRPELLDAPNPEIVAATLISA